jgi:hypothetical protein
MSDLPIRIRAFARPFRSLGRLAALLLAVLVLACGGRYQSGGALQVVNAGTRNMVGLKITPSTSPTWGPEQLAPSVMVPGGWLTLAGMPPDFYDVQATFVDGVVDTVNDVRILDGATAVLSMTNVGAVQVVNASGAWITAIYLVPHSATSWGSDQLLGVLYPGLPFTLTDVTAGTYDLEVVFLDGSHQDHLGFAVDPATTTTITIQ